MIKDKSIFIKNIYYMLTYAFTNLKQSDYEDVATEEFENIHDLFAAILAKGIGRQLKQGLYREYLNHKEDLTVVRGKIDMPGTIKNRLSRKRMVTCEYDELSENNLFNQILKTTVLLLLRHARVSFEYKSDLKKEMLFFSNVETIDPATIRWSTIRFQRNNNTYRMLISLCQLILEGMLLTTDDGEYKLATFIDEQRMSRLYEKFILEYYVKECPQVKATASQIPWALDDGVGTMLPVMQSDITLTRGKEVLIIDAKYYTRTTQSQYDTHTLHSGNLYQIFTYVKNKEAELKDQIHKVSGMLLYAATDEAIQPDNVYQMSGNQISVKTLDLNREFSEIAEQLDKIVDEHFGEKEIDANRSIHHLKRRYKDMVKYAEIMNEIGVNDISKNKILQKTFNAFYRVRRNEVWRKEFYKLFEECKRKEEVSFEFILREMFKRTKMVESSFSSKMLATINPQMPIWDSIVLSKLEIKSRAYKDQQTRLDEAVEIYERIVDWYKEFLETSKAQVALKEFDKAFPEFIWMTNIKKIDFILWGGGEDNPF